jgi:hypothetical protein
MLLSVLVSSATTFDLSSPSRQPVKSTSPHLSPHSILRFYLQSPILLFLSESLSIMAILSQTELVNAVNCPVCGYNNITKATHCAGQVDDGNGGVRPCNNPLPEVR